MGGPRRPPRIPRKVMRIWTKAILRLQVSLISLTNLCESEEEVDWRSELIRQFRELVYLFERNQDRVVFDHLEVRGRMKITGSRAWKSSLCRVNPF